MSPHQGGWRTARAVAPAPQHPRLDATPAAGAAARPARGPAVVLQGDPNDGTIKSLLKNGNWSLSFVGVLGYVYAAVTYALPIVGPSIVIALLGLAFERTRIVVPPFLVIFALYLAWAGAGYATSYQP